MRFIIRNNHDVDGITERIIELIEKEYGVEYGAVFDYGDSRRNKREDIEYFNYKYCTSDAVQIDANTLKTPIPRSVLDGMLKYKCMALNLVSRESHYNIYRMDYLEEFYYERLQYWYNFLTEKKIDFVLFLVQPHHTGEYILSRLCELLSIKQLIMNTLVLEGTFAPSNIINDSSMFIMQNYNELDAESYDLNDSVRSFVEKVKKDSAFSLRDKKVAQKEVHSLLYSFYSVKSVMIALRRLITIPLLPKNRENREYESEANKRYLRVVYEMMREERRMDHIRDYNRLSVVPDLSDRYIYFPLQQEPEDTTMPRAGEFKNQLLALLILSRAAEEIGAKVYVKEHWVQEHRGKGYYKRIASFNNVELVDLNVNSRDLIINSIAVASETGTCIIEAMILDKNSLIFGEGCDYRGIPGSYYINDVSDAVSALKLIEKKGDVISENDKLRYLYAYQNSYVEFYCSSPEESKGHYNLGDCAKRIVDFINNVAQYEG